MGTRGIYLDRLRYLEKTKQMAQLYNLDNWDEKEFFYARINKNGRVVAPLDRTTLKQLPGSDLFALDFVVDAFQDMNRQYTSEIAKGLQPLASGRTLLAKRAYKNPLTLYQEHLDSLEERFFDDYLEPFKNKINLFDDLLFYFMEFAKKIAREEPILYSSFVKSAKCPIHSTGLVIEVAKESHNEDAEKYNILSSKDFNFYTKMAARFGFVIPKHAPWSFIANLDSTSMFEYIKQYDVANKESVMDEYFYECVNYDIDLLRKFLYDVYVEFSRVNSVKSTVKIVNGKTRTKTRNVLRPPLKKVISQHGYRKWFETYMKVLVVDNQIQISDNRFDSLFEKCYYVLNSLGFEHAIQYAEMKILDKRKDTLR